ncbi:MAG TPA: chorismate synthase [Campylobacterales bacterium]|nr:chorismate synthase [Campylobacterales bacterium]HIO71302.1 chorismate synthase [Campylobacterales bacterium]
MNSFGRLFSFTTFGESHGKAVGVVIDGVPAGLEFDETFIQDEVDRRRPGRNSFATARKESDKIEVLSGVFEGKTTGTPIGIVIYNTNQKSKDYSKIRDIFRPGHADFTYFHKYGIRDYRGGGRSSARETVARVVAGAVAKLVLRELKIEVLSGVSHIHGIGSSDYNFHHARKSEIYSLTPKLEEAQKQAILEAKENHDSVGGTAVVRIKHIPIGLGEPIYYKLDAVLADAMMSINGVKGVEIGSGIDSTTRLGSENNDEMDRHGFISNNAGGILGGISNGNYIDIKVHFKPTPSIFRPQTTQDIFGNVQELKLKGRHDPVIAVRGSVVAEAMASIVLVDMLLLNMGRTIDGIRNFYHK